MREVTMDVFAESAAEINKMDILVCGNCYFVSHFVDEFIAHKEQPCERTENIQPNTSDQKPQVWSFLLWKNSKNRANSQSSSWQLYQEWCALPENVKDTWIQAGQFLKSSSTIKTSRHTFSDDHNIFLVEEELSQTRAMVPGHPIANSNKVLKKTRSGKYLEVNIERILAKRIVNKKTEYWVKYKGRSAVEEKFWEPVEAMQPTCGEMITAFENKYLATNVRKRTLSQSLENAGLLNNTVGNKQKMEHVKQWIQDDTSGKMHSKDDELAKKRPRTDENDNEDFEEFFNRQYGGIIRRIDMKSCPPLTEGAEVQNKKISNLAAEIGLESEEDEEDGDKEKNIFGRKNVPAVLKPNEQKVLVVNSQGVVALDPVEIPNLSSGIYIMTNKHDDGKTTPTKKQNAPSGGYVVLDEYERSIKMASNENLGRVTSYSSMKHGPNPKMPNLSSFKSGALTITPSVRNISKDIVANNIIKRNTPIQPHIHQNQSMQKILGPKNTTPKHRPMQTQVMYTTSRQQPQITYLNSSGETTNKRVLGSVNRYKAATVDKQQINHSETHYTSAKTKTIMKSELSEQSNLLIPTSNYQLDNTGEVTDTLMIKVEMPSEGTNQFVQGIQSLDSPHFVKTGVQGHVSGLKVKRITEPRKPNSNIRESAHISILNRKDVSGTGSALAVPARKLNMFRNEEEDGEDVADLSPVTQQEEMVTIAGEDGTLYQVASSELQGSAVLLTTGEDGQQQCLYVTDENGQPSIIQGATIDGQEMLLDQTVYNEATGTIQMFQDQSGLETQVYTQDENGQLLPVENPSMVLAQVQAAQQVELLQQQEKEQHQEIHLEETQQLTSEQAAEFLQQQQQLNQKESDGLEEQQSQVENMQVDGMQVEGVDQGDSSEVVAQLVEASEPAADGGPRKVVLLLSDGNLIQTEMSEEQFAALENS